MPSKARDHKDFQIKFLKFLSDKKVAEVHIYHHVMNYWSNDSSMISLQSLKDAITELCERKFIVSKNNGHLSLGVPGISEEEQKNNAICSIQKAGSRYIRLNDNIQIVKKAFALLLVIGALLLLWHFRKMIIYFFK